MEKSEQFQPHTWILGIDVSKQSIDVCLIRSSDGQLYESKFHNNLSGFRHLKRWCREMKCECDSSTLCCMEHTGNRKRGLKRKSDTRSDCLRQSLRMFVGEKTQTKARAGVSVSSHRTVMKT